MQWCLFTGAISSEPDFLFVYSKATHLHKDGSPFVQSLVDILDEGLNDEHLEDALFRVKDASNGWTYQQMPLVLSQMRDRVWFHK